LAPLSLFFSRAASACPAESVKELRLRIATLNSDGLSDSMIAARLRVPARTVSYHRSRMGLKTSKRRG
jgi:DNA-binding NarL/FixJ family response regulator